MAESWNTHRKRPDRKHNQPGGRPVLLYTLPELSGYEDKMMPVDMRDVAECERESLRKGENPCSDPYIFNLTCILMEENGLDCPGTGYEAASLYMRLRRIIRNHLGMHC